MVRAVNQYSSVTAASVPRVAYPSKSSGLRCKIREVRRFFYWCRSRYGAFDFSAVVPVLEDDDANHLATRVLVQEHIIFPQVPEDVAGRKVVLQR